MTDLAVTQDTLSAPQRFNATRLLNQSLPWLVTALTFIAVTNITDLQSLATFAGEGKPGAYDSAKWVWLTPAAAFAAGLATAYFRSVRLRAVAAAVSCVLVSVLALISPAALMPLLLAPVAVIAAELFDPQKSGSPVRLDLIAGALLTLIVAYASHKRQYMFFQLVNQPPDPDLDSYLQFARESTGWATYYREPFYVWVLQLVDAFGGELNVIMARLTGILTSLGAIASVFYLCYRHLNLGVAVVAALIYASQKFMVFTAVRGLREDTIIMTTLLFISVSWSHLRGPVSWRSLTVWGVLGAACSLLRISSFSYCLIVIAGVAVFRALRDIKPWALRARFLLPAVLTVVLFAPYLLHCKKEYNNPMFVVTNAVRYYANQELGGKHPDFPTAAEIQKDPSAGGPITAGKYIFGYHSIGEVVQRTWSGFTKTFFGSVFKIGYNLQENPGIGGIIYILHFLGIALLLIPRNIFLFLAIMLFHGPLFFLGSFDFFDPRLLIVAMPFAYITVASALGLTLAYAWQYLRPQTADAPAYGAAARRRDKKPVRPQAKKKSAV